MSSSTSEERQHIHVLHFNDVYHITERRIGGGAARFVAKVRALEEEHGPCLILFSGDVFNPSLLSTVTKGWHMVPILNAIGPQVACVGNHDFDFGPEVSAKQMDATECTWVLTNLCEDAQGTAVAGTVCTHMLEWQGVKFGFMGMIEREWLDTLTCMSDSLVYTDFCESAEATAKQLRADGAEVVVALSHMRLPHDEQLRTVEGVDMVLGGHDHFHQVVPADEKGCMVVKSGTDFCDLSHFVWEMGSGVVGDVEHITITKEDHCDEETAKLVSEWSSQLDAQTAKVIGRTDRPLDGRTETVRTKESNLGNFVTDVMRRMTQADVALLNGGSLRGNELFEEGEITLGMLLTFLPIEDEVVVLKLTGAQLVECLENGASKWPSHEGRFLQVSGLHVRLDGRREAGERVQSVCLVDDDGNETALEVDKEYSVATRNYLAKGHDGFTMMLDKPVVVDEENGMLLPSMIRYWMRMQRIVAEWKKGKRITPRTWHIIHQSHIRPEVEGRIVFVEE